MGAPSTFYAPESTNSLETYQDEGNRLIVAPGMKNSSPEACFTETEGRDS